jgi:iron complex transport system substrate-binding protein
MRAFVFVSALSLALAGAAEAAPARRAASLNLCTDELLLMLAKPGQIASVTHLSHQPAETRLWQRARRYPKNDGSLPSVAGLRPDLILGMGGGARDRMRIAAHLGARTLDLPYPQSIADVEQAIGRVSEALGRPAAGEAILKQISALKRTMPKYRPDTIWLGGGGRTVPASGLAAEWMTLAGFRQRSMVGDRVSLEQLLVRPPKILLRSDYRSGQFSSEQRWLSHPLARGAFMRRWPVPRTGLSRAASRTIVSDGRPWTCLGPPMIAEAFRLRQVLRR